MRGPVLDLQSRSTLYVKISLIILKQIIFQKH